MSDIISEDELKANMKPTYPTKPKAKEKKKKKKSDPFKPAETAVGEKG